MLAAGWRFMHIGYMGTFGTGKIMTHGGEWRNRSLSCRIHAFHLTLARDEVVLQKGQCRWKRDCLIVGRGHCGIVLSLIPGNNNTYAWRCTGWAGRAHTAGANINLRLWPPPVHRCRSLFVFTFMALKFLPLKIKTFPMVIDSRGWWAHRGCALPCCARWLVKHKTPIDISHKLSVFYCSPIYCHIDCCLGHPGTRHPASMLAGVAGQTQSHWCTNADPTPHIKGDASTIAYTMLWLLYLSSKYSLCIYNAQ